MLIDAGLEGAVIIVTGGGSGIGAATARRLGAAGAPVVLVGRRETALKEVAAQIAGDGGEALCVTADLADPASPRRIVDGCLARYGRLDGLVNNAAVVRHMPLAEWDVGRFDEHVAVNVRAPFFLIQAALPALRESPVRAVVNVSSSSGTLRRVGQSVYGMTKSALDYLTQTMAGELAEFGVRVNSISPGPVDTPIHATWADDLAEAYRWLGSQVPLGRIGTPEEVAVWITLLLSPVASFMTGAVIPLDGGQVIDRELAHSSTRVAGQVGRRAMRAEPDGREGRATGEDLLLRVAWFYYKDELTQDEIARRLSVSRASVGRMLDRARKVGLVSINLNAEHLGAFEVSRQLRRTFHLAEALVIPDHETEVGDHHALNARVGLGGAQFMSTHLRPGGTLGVGWGETVSRVIASTNFGAVGPIHMVSLTGGVDAYLQAFLSYKSEGAAEGEMTSATVIPAPIVASTPGLAAALKAEPAIQQVLKQACAVEQAIVGVGTPTADATIVQMGYLEAEDVRALGAQDVVGDILGQFFDASGQVVKLPIHDRRIGIDLADLAQIPKVVGVAGGLHKVEAILGALRGGFLDVLVTNELAALRLLELERTPSTGQSPAGS